MRFGRPVLLAAMRTKGSKYLVDVRPIQLRKFKNTLIGLSRIVLRQTGIKKTASLRSDLRNVEFWLVQAERIV